MCVNCGRLVVGGDGVVRVRDVAFDKDVELFRAIERKRGGEGYGGEID